MKKTTRITLKTLGTLGLLLWLVPLIVSWDFIKKDVEKAASLALKTPVTIAGMRPMIFPFPGVTASGIKITEKKSAAGNTLLKGDIAEVTARLSWFNLLLLNAKATVRITEPRLVVDQKFFETLGEKTPIEKAPLKKEQSAKTSLEDTHRTLTETRSQIPIVREIGMRIFIDDMHVTYLDNDQKMVIDRGDIKLEAQSLFGAYHIDAVLAYNGVPVTAEFLLDHFHPTNPSAVFLDMTYDNIQMVLNGSVRQQAMQLTGDIKGGWGARHKGISAQPVTFSGAFDISPKKIDIDLKSLKLGPTEGIGKVHVLLEPSVQGTVEFSKLPGNTKITGNLSRDKNRSKGKLMIHSDRLQSLLAAMPGAPPILTRDGALTLKTDLSLNAAKKTFSLKNIDVDCGPARLDGFIKIAYDTMRISNTLSIPSVGQWLHLFNAKHDPKAPGPIKLQGAVTLKGDRIIIDEKLDLQPGSVTVIGEYAQGKLDVTYDTSLHDLAKTLKNLTGNPESLDGKIDLKGTVTGGPENLKINAEVIEVAMNDMALKAMGAIGYIQGVDKKRPTLDANFTLNELTLKSTVSPGDKPTPGEKKKAVAPSTKSEKPVVIEEPGNLVESLPLDGHITFVIPKKSNIAGIPIDGLKAIVDFNKDHIMLTSLTGNVAGGDVQGTATLTANGTKNFIRLGGKDIVLAQIVNGVMKEKMLSGVTTQLQVDLASPGNGNLMQFMKKATGEIILSSKEGEITSTKLLLACRLINLLKGTPLGRNLGKGICDGTPVNLSTMDINMAVENGQGTLKKAAILSEITDGTFTGGVNFLEQNVDIKGEATIKVIDDVPPMPITITGPFSQIKCEVDSDGLATRLLTSNIAGALGLDLSGKNAEKMLSGALSKSLGVSIPGLGGLMDLASGKGNIGSLIGNVAGAAIGGPIGAAVLGGLFGAFGGGSKKKSDPEKGVPEDDAGNDRKDDTAKDLANKPANKPEDNASETPK